MSIIKNFEVNHQIRDPKVRLIDQDGNQVGIVSAYEALRLAEEKNLDLVKISPSSKPPVCKIMDYGKFKFDMAKKERDARRNQKTSEIKEVWLSMTIDTHDLETKAKNAAKFLNNGDKVKVSIRMRGRQQAHPELGIEVMNKFFEYVKDLSVKDKAAFQEGRNIVMMLSPQKSK